MIALVNYLFILFFLSILSLSFSLSLSVCVFTSHSHSPTIILSLNISILLSTSFPLLFQLHEKSNLSFLTELTNSVKYKEFTIFTLYACPELLLDWSIFELFEGVATHMLVIPIFRDMVRNYTFLFVIYHLLIYLSMSFIYLLKLLFFYLFLFLIYEHFYLRKLLFFDIFVFLIHLYFYILTLYVFIFSFVVLFFL